MNFASINQTRPGVLLLGNYRPTMPVARAFKEHGYRVITSLAGCDQGAEFSRYVDAIWNHPLLQTNQQVFVDTLQSYVLKNPDIKIIVPVSEEYTRLFANQKLEFRRPIEILTPDPDAVSLCLDKVRLLGKATELGLPVAPFIMANTLDRILDAGKAFGYPLVIRPEHSTNRLFDKKAITVESANDVGRQLPRWPDGHDSLLVQRKVGGIRHNLYFAARQGCFERILHSKILRTDRADGSGLAVEGVTVKPDPAILRFTQTLIKDMDYSGVGCAQFLVDEKSGDLHFLEINPRIAGNHALPEHCQLGLTDWLIESRSRHPDDSPKYLVARAGIRYSWLAGDLQGLKLAWLQKEISFTQAISWLALAIKTYLRSDMDIMLNRHDPKPGLAALASVILGAKSKSFLGKFSNHKPKSPTKASVKLAKVPTHENVRPN